MRSGLPARMIHGYVRHGTTSLFAALEVATGKVSQRCSGQHTHQEFLAFLKILDRKYRRLEIHLICDNYGTHKHPAVREWLARHPRFHIHLTPTSASWLNLVERWFARITQEAIRRGTFHTVTALERAILRYTKTWNQNPKPFIWTKTATRIRHANQTSVTGLVTIEGSVDRRLERGRRLAGVVFDEVGELALSDRGLRVAGGFVEPRATLE